MKLRLPTGAKASRHSKQRGVATLMVTLSILIILTIIVLASTNVALFEQKTATNESRARLSEQSAEYALNIAGEYLKANVSKLSTTATNGWLNAGSLHWKSCAAVTDTTHPCFAERTSSIRNQMYYYTSDGNEHLTGSATELNLPYDSLLPANTIQLSVTGSGGTTAFPTTATVKALLCRIETVTGSAPVCDLTPSSGRRIAVTLISEAKLAGEQSAAVIKETWGTVSSSSFSSSTPLVAAGTINIIGTFTLVNSPNAGGPGARASVWSPADAGGNGTWQSCKVEDYLGDYSLANLTTQVGCAKVNINPKCLCDGVASTAVDGVGTAVGPPMSTGGNPDGIDIVDRDGNAGALPDITFFPGSTDYTSQANRDATRLDYRLCTATSADCLSVGSCPVSHPGCLTDDNLFEWTFGVDVTSGDTTVVATNCSVPASFNPGGLHDGDCELKALYDLGFTPVADCAGLNAASSGLIYVTGSCDLADADNFIGTAAKPVVLVVDNDVTLGQLDNFFGMLFIRSPPMNGATVNPLNMAEIKGVANGKWFGSVIIEGMADHLNGTMDLVYMDTSAGSPDDPLADTTRFARLPGSWLDNAKGF